MNIDPVILLVKKSASPAAAKIELLKGVWESSVVVEMVKDSGSEISRPDNLQHEFGLHKDGYRLSPEQAQAILELRLQKLTGLEKEKILKEIRPNIKPEQYITEEQENQILQDFLKEKDQII